MGPSLFPSSGGGGGVGGGGGPISGGGTGGGSGATSNIRLHGSEVPPPPGVLPNLMASASSGALSYCPAFVRGQTAVMQQTNHNQLLGTNSNIISNKYLCFFMYIFYEF
jgi:hypothetical protein